MVEVAFFLEHEEWEATGIAQSTRSTWGIKGDQTWPEYRMHEGEWWEIATNASSGQIRNPEWQALEFGFTFVGNG